MNNIKYYNNMTIINKLLIWIRISGGVNIIKIYCIMFYDIYNTQDRVLCFMYVHILFYTMKYTLPKLYKKN